MKKIVGAVEDFLLTPGAVYLLAGAVAVAALVVLTRKGVAASTGVAVGGAAVDLVDGVIIGTVTGIGDVVGIPQTNMTECQRALDEGRTWDASFLCPAKTFLDNLFGGSEYRPRPDAGRGATGNW